MAATYEVQVQTGNKITAGTHATVRITITGQKGAVIGPFDLDRYFHNDLEKGETTQYTFKGKDVGDLLMITLKNKGSWFGLEDDWYVNRINISKSPNTSHMVYDFPIFRWVIKELTVFEGTALLPCQKQDEVVKEQRKKEVENNQKLYQWGSDPCYSDDLPGFINADTPKDLPKDVQFTSQDSYSLFGRKMNGKLNQLLGGFFGKFISWDQFTDFQTCFIPEIMGPYPPATEKWQDDVWYGSQFLNGCNPEVIKLCKKLPAKFTVTDEMVGNQLDRGYSLHKAIKEGHIYMVDYEILNGIPTFQKEVDIRHIAPAMGLFFVRNSGLLVPIAIQLHQIPGEGNPIWTPNDMKYDWLNAKLWLRAADTQYHQMISHLLRCHLMMKPIAVASWRQLPSLHPVWKILYPHIRGVMAINALGRQKLIGPGGIADRVLSVGGGGHIKLMQAHYRQLSWKSYDLPNCLKERGVDDEKKLPNFYYRDDALDLWKAIEKFIKDVIYIYYSSDDDVVNDDEIQNWAKDLNVNGYPSTSHGSVSKEFPASFKTREELIHYLTMAIFTSSCQHAAVNFSQKDVYGFHPNSPSLMRKPNPCKKGETCLKNTMDTLATQSQSATMVFIVNELTTIYPDEKFLGDYNEFLFTDASVADAVARFNGRLDSIEGRINERNKKLEVPYEYLNPKRGYKQHCYLNVYMIFSGVFCTMICYPFYATN